MTKKSKKIKNGTYLVSSSNEYYDDCPICRLMKKAEEEGQSPTTEEIIKASKEAEAQGAVVGGSILQKPNKV